MNIPSSPATKAYELFPDAPIQFRILDALSVVPSAIPKIKQGLAALKLEPMRQAIAGILRLSAVASALKAVCAS